MTNLDLIFSEDKNSTMPQLKTNKYKKQQKKKLWELREKQQLIQQQPLSSIKKSKNEEEESLLQPLLTNTFDPLQTFKDTLHDGNILLCDAVINDIEWCVLVVTGNESSPSHDKDKDDDDDDDTIDEDCLFKRRALMFSFSPHGKKKVSVCTTRLALAQIHRKQNKTVFV